MSPWPDARFWGITFAHRLCAEGLARMENGVFRLTDEGMLVSNSILGELFEEEPESAE